MIPLIKSHGLALTQRLEAVEALFCGVRWPTSLEGERGGAPCQVLGRKSMFGKRNEPL